MRTFWLYTLARLGIIIAVGLILFPFLGFNMVMALTAIIVGALLSYLFLGRMRAQVANDIEEKFVKRPGKPKRKSADEEAEDQIVADRIDEEKLGDDSDESK